MKTLDSSITIIDRFEHLRFVTATSISDLEVGMMVQAVEKNTEPYSWEWIYLSKSVLEKMRIIDPEGFLWVRLPAYANIN